MKKGMIFFVTLVIVFLQLTQAKTWVVATSGNDKANGSLITPFATLQKGIDSASCGDTIMIRGGIYEHASVKIHKSGNSKDGPIVFINYPGEVPILSGWVNYQNQTYNASEIPEWCCFCGDSISYITIEGLYFTGYQAPISLNYENGFDPWKDSRDNTNRGTNITIRYCAADRCGTAGFIVFNSNHVLIENCVTSRCGFTLPSWSSGIALWQVGHNCIIRNNVSFQNIDVSSYNTDGNGIIVDVSRYYSRVDVYNNICFDNGGAGIAVTLSANVRLYNNTMFGNAYKAGYSANLIIVTDISFTGLIVRNNLIWAASNGGTNIHQLSGNIFNSPSNVSGNNFTKPGSGIIVTDPQLLNYGTPCNPGLQSTSPYLKAADRQLVPSDDNGLDWNVIKTQTAGQFVPQWKHAIDLNYIISQGGLKNCYHPKYRGKVPDAGAVQTSLSGSFVTE